MHPGSGTTLSTGDGRRRVRLGKLIKSGGAGSVYRLADDTASVAKIYHADQDLPLYERKVSAMLALTPQLPALADGGQQYVQIAWPQALLRDDRGRFVGWLMPAVHVDQTSELECILQERQALQHRLPTGLGAKITLAANLAAVIAELHRQRHHVVDMKPVNLRFYPQSLYMAMLDCDGFSIQGRGERFVATQVTPDYLAPEFQRGGLTAAGEETQDRFALATIVFQLLNFGLHPYSGRPANDRVATDIPGRIGQRAYPYGRRTNPAIAPNPVSGHLAIAADLRVLFDRAFESSGSGRPAASEWATALRAHAQRSAGKLVACTRDPAHQHFVGLPCAACARAALIAGTAQRAGEARTAAAARVARALPPSAPGYSRPRSPPPAPPAARPSTRRPWQPSPPPPGRPLPPARPYPLPRSRLPGSSRSSGWATLWSILTWRFGFGRQTSLLELLIVAIIGMVYFVSQNDGFERGKSEYQRQAQVARAAREAAVAREEQRLEEARAAAPAPAAAPTTPAPRSAPPDPRQSLVEQEIAGAITDVLAGERFYLATASTRPRGAGSADNLANLDGYVRMDAATRRAQIAAVGARATASPRDLHLQADLGWLLLLDGRPAEARVAFVQSISEAPDRPSPWHGLALVATTDRDRVGARAIAEILAAAHGIAPQVRAPVQAAEAALGLDAARWRLVDARARMLAAYRLRAPVSDELRDLARQPLPQ